MAATYEVLLRGVAVVGHQQEDPLAATLRASLPTSTLIDLTRTHDLVKLEFRVMVNDRDAPAACSHAEQLVSRALQAASPWHEEAVANAVSAQLRS